jgi:hypothetical protein
MSEAYSGGCACGAIRYEISGRRLEDLGPSQAALIDSFSEPRSF